MLDLDIQADRILRAHGSAKLELIPFDHSEIFEPFKPGRWPVSALTKRIAKRSKYRCGRCAGPRSSYQTLCPRCRADGLKEVAIIDDYWRKLELPPLERTLLADEYDERVQIEPDFSPRLIDRIYAREKQIGPAAFWPRGETAVH